MRIAQSFNLLCCDVYSLIGGRVGSPTISLVKPVHLHYSPIAIIIVMYFSVLITGANRGLGLGLVKQFLVLENRPELILAIVRDLSSAQVSVTLLLTKVTVINHS